MSAAALTCPACSSVVSGRRAIAFAPSRSLPWAAVYQMRAAGLTTREIELSLLREGRFESAAEAHGFVESIEAEARAHHTRLRMAVRRDVQRSVWSILVGSVLLAGIFLFEGGFHGSMGSLFALTALGMMAGGAIKLGRLLAARNNDEALAVLTAPREAEPRRMADRNSSEIISEQAFRQGAAMQDAQVSGVRLL